MKNYYRLVPALSWPASTIPSFGRSSLIRSSHPSYFDLVLYYERATARKESVKRRNGERDSLTLRNPLLHLAGKIKLPWYTHAAFPRGISSFFPRPKHCFRSGWHDFLSLPAPVRLLSIALGTLAVVLSVALLLKKYRKRDK